MMQMCTSLFVLLSNFVFVSITVASNQTVGKSNIPTTPAVDSQSFERSQLFGEPVYDAAGKLLYVVENKSQTHSRDNFVNLRVKGIKVRPDDKEIGRIRVAVWDSKDSYGKEGVKPFRSSSHWAKESVNGEMVFRIGGLEVGKSYSFFAHFDRENKGIVKRNFLRIPVDPYIFTSAKTKGQGAGLKREGLSAPKFENTLVPFTGTGQEIILTF